MEFLEDIGKACEVLYQGGIILYPTDTVWGIGCDATDEKAVRRVYELKKRADHRAMLVLLDTEAKLSGFVSEVPEIAWDLIAMSDKPLTIIYPQGKNFASGLLGEDGSVGIRITQETFSKQLCARFRKPLVSTSANISGEPTPSNYAEISEEVRNGVDYIVSYRREDTTQCKPSGIIRIHRDHTIQIIRK